MKNHVHFGNLLFHEVISGEIWQEIIFRPFEPFNKKLGRKVPTMSEIRTSLKHINFCQWKLALKVFSVSKAKATKVKGGE